MNNNMNNIGLMDFPEKIRESFSNVPRINLDDAEAKIVDNFVKGLITEDAFSDVIDVLNKGKRFNIGDISTHGGVKVKKMADGKWKPVKEGKKSGKHDDIDPQISKFLDQFPKDATTWKLATDEVRDISRMSRRYLSDMQNIEVPAVDFTEIKTPSEWNTKSKESIVANIGKMNDTTRKEFYRDVKSKFGIKDKKPKVSNEEFKSLVDAIQNRSLEYNYIPNAEHLILSKKELDRIARKRGFSDSNDYYKAAQGAFGNEKSQFYQSDQAKASNIAAEKIARDIISGKYGEYGKDIPKVKNQKRVPFPRDMGNKHTVQMQRLARGKKKL